MINSMESISHSMETRPSEVPGPGRQKHFLSTHRDPAPLQGAFRNNPFLNYLLGVRSCDIAIIYYNFLKHIPRWIMIDKTKSRVSWQHQTTSFAEVSKKTFHNSPISVLAFHAAFSGIWCSSKESQWVTRSHHVRFIPPRLLRDSASTCLKLDLGHAAKKPLLTNSITTALLTWTSLTWKNDEWRYVWASNDSTNSLKMM